MFVLLGTSFCGRLPFRIRDIFCQFTSRPSPLVRWLIISTKVYEYRISTFSCITFLARARTGGLPFLLFLYLAARVVCVHMARFGMQSCAHTEMMIGCTRCDATS